MLDVEKLALDAGLPAAIAKKFRRDRGQEMTEPEKEYWANVERFAALVLEAAAVECDAVYYRNIGPQFGDVRYGIAECAKAIRSMKPGESNE